jgi:type VI secretion system protein ImpL
MGASGSSAKANTLRRILLISAAALCLVLCIGFTVSFWLNHGLERQVVEALRGTAVAPPAGSLAPVDSLRRLENLRQSLETLTVYNREGAPWSYRWFLYAGDELYPDVRRLYFGRFKALLFGQTQNSLAGVLSGLPAAPAQPAVPAYDPTYEALKAYLITTSNHEKSTREFLSPVLLRTWSAGASVDAERLQLAQKQFDFYSDELRVEDPYKHAAGEDSAVLRARTYLSKFDPINRVYQTIKAGAPKTSVNFNRQIPGSSKYVEDSYEVPGPFTKEAYKYMSEAIQHPDRYYKGEVWVLGKEGNVKADPSELIKPLLSKYETDSIDEWRAYLRSARVVKYADLREASEKLTMLSGAQSPLLALFALASRNIPWDDPETAKALQPAQSVEPPADVKYINPQNTAYVSALGKLQTGVDAVVNSAAGNDAAATQTLNDARDAKNAANQVAQNFNPGTDPDDVVKKLLLAPIIDVEAKLRGLGPGDLNTAGKALCGQFHGVLNKYPFNPASKQDATVGDLNSILRKPDGALWKFYEDNLKKFLTKQGSEYALVPGASVTLTPRFVEFFKQAAAFSEFLYAGGGDPHFTYTLKPVKTETVEIIGLEIDEKKLDFPGGTAMQFTWQASSHSAKGTYGAEGGSFSENLGTWAIFRLFGDADSHTASGGGGVFFDWIVKTGNPPKPSTRNGKPVTVRLELDMTGPPVFQKGFFSHLACVSEVAKP